MTRACIVTGAASGVGRAATAILESRGARVIGVDLRDTEVIADLSTPEGRIQMARDVEAASGGSVDALIAAAGVLVAGPLTVQVNFFGVVEGAEALRPLLARSDAPRVAVVSSVAGYSELGRADIVDACLAGDEPAAIGAATRAVDEGEGDRIYASSKQAVSRWVRRTAPAGRWAGEGITLNAVAPGIVTTPMTQRLLANESSRAWMDADVPMPLGGHATPEQIAEVLVWLAGPENSIVTGQVLYADGGADATVRGDDVW
ncbi:MAG TPA: SDR family oxidoreductase [Acidimicrobiia bacterium]|nr:SDR family oxidoreductase [Acidimicrobiia bacterium]